MSGGAAHLARIHGTEEDKVNCPFYYKIGACRHGERCSRKHHKPQFSQTILVPHMWQNPVSLLTAAGLDQAQLDVAKAQEEFDEFYYEVYEELSRHGKIEEMNVCDNLGDHLVGNVYVKFEDEEEADSALKSLFGRYYNCRPLVTEFSPVTEFREARCRQYDEGVCKRGGYCNFMHVHKISKGLKRELHERFGPSPGIFYRPSRHSRDDDRTYHPDWEPKKRVRSEEAAADERKDRDDDRSGEKDRDADRDRSGDRNPDPRGR
uniref:Uncharacterized protein n=1 Tax=Pinguiococcus pyrenoidosus TaxID=172671 RepID=A0A7R9U5X8_9STRA